MCFYPGFETCSSFFVPPIYGRPSDRISHCIQGTSYNFRDLACEIWGHSIPYLVVHGSSRSLETVVVWKCLKTRSLANSQTSALCWIVVDIIVAVLGNMGSDGSGYLVGQLNPEAVRKTVNWVFQN